MKSSERGNSRAESDRDPASERNRTGTHNDYHQMHATSSVNLIIVRQWKKVSSSDLLDIASRIVRKSQQVRVSVVAPSDTSDVLPDSAWQLPSLTVSFGATGNFNPTRGRVFTNKAIPKVVQAGRLAEAGIDTPRTANFHFGMSLPRNEWGEFVILKPVPLRLTSSGEGIYLYRTARLATLTPNDLPTDHLARRVPMIVQQFIDTGERVSKQRITTLFGEPFHWAHSIVKASRPALTSSDEALDKIRVSTSAGGTDLVV